MPKLVGVALAPQKVHAVPTDEFDVKLDSVVFASDNAQNR